jgi:hypothetical protein
VLGRYIFIGALSPEHNDFGYLNNKTFLIFDTTDNAIRTVALRTLTGDLSYKADDDIVLKIKDAFADYMTSSFKNRNGVSIFELI